MRCVTAFEFFPHPFTGAAPQILAELAAQQGIRAVDQAWNAVTGHALPQHIRELIDEENRSATRGGKDQ